MFVDVSLCVLCVYARDFLGPGGCSLYTTLGRRTFTLLEGFTFVNGAGVVCS